MGTTHHVVEFKIVSKSAEKHRVYGWFSISKNTAGKLVVDIQGDVIYPEDLEDAAAEFVKQYRQGGEMHVGRAPNELIASVVLTEDIQKALGIPAETIPQGWFGGFEVPDETFKKVKEGSRLMFSIEGEGDREDAA